MMVMMVTMSFPVMHTDNGNPGIRIFPVQRVQHFFLLQVLKSSRFNTKKYICYSTMGVFFWSHCNLKVLTFGGNYLQDIWKADRVHLIAVCDETQNLSETESETFFRYQFFSIPNPILFSIPNFFRYRYFFRYQIFFETDTVTVFNTKIFQNRYDTIKKMEKFQNREVSKPNCHSAWGFSFFVPHLMRFIGDGHRSIKYN